jgi:hypothetical protein
MKAVIFTATVVSFYDVNCIQMEALNASNGV